MGHEPNPPVQLWEWGEPNPPVPVVGMGLEPNPPVPSIPVVGMGREPNPLDDTTVTVAGMGLEPNPPQQVPINVSMLPGHQSNLSDFARSSSVMGHEPSQLGVPLPQTSVVQGTQSELRGGELVNNMYSQSCSTIVGANLSVAPRIENIPLPITSSLPLDISVPQTLKDKIMSNQFVELSIAKSHPMGSV